MIANFANRNDRRAFTLVELLVVIGLITILATMLSYALSSARQEGRIKRTQNEVLMISQILQSKMNDISLSKLELLYSPPANQMTLGASPNPTQERSRLVVLARRDLMRLAMPECRLDVILPPANLQFRTRNVNTVNSWAANCAKVSAPGEWNRMRGLLGLRSVSKADSDYKLAGGAGLPGEAPGLDAATLYFAGHPYANFLASTAAGVRIDLPETDPAQPSGTTVADVWTREHESAECLYLILASTDLFGETAIDKIHPRSIANQDGDLVPEIIDPWERPYEYIRDPIGLKSPAIKNYDPNKPAADQFPIEPDPLDFLLADWRYDEVVNPPSVNPPNQRFYPIYLPPAVISAGPDGEFDLERTYYKDENNTQRGVNDYYSTAIITWTAPGLAPLYPDPFAGGGGGTLPYRYPDPYYNVTAIAYGSSTPYEITNSDLGQVDLAKQGGGLGGFIDRDGYDASADNITSLDGGF